MSIIDWIQLKKSDVSNSHPLQLVGFGSLSIEKISQLEDLGLYLGCKIQLVEKGIGYNPILLQIQNSQIAIDKQDALQLELAATKP